MPPVSQAFCPIGCICWHAMQQEAGGRGGKSRWSHRLRLLASLKRACCGQAGWWGWQLSCLHDLLELA